jgi:hypothetical protein
MWLFHILAAFPIWLAEVKVTNDPAIFLLLSTRAGLRNQGRKTEGCIFSFLCRIGFN